jgi:hypothetical protein
VYLLGVGLALVALALAVTDWALSLQPGVTQRNVNRIRPGMTRAQVESILGNRGARADYDGFLGGFNLRWTGESGSVLVQFSRDGAAYEASWQASRIGPSAGPLARLRAWLGW